MPDKCISRLLVAQLARGIGEGHADLGHGLDGQGAPDRGDPAPATSLLEFRQTDPGLATPPANERLRRRLRVSQDQILPRPGDQPVLADAPTGPDNLFLEFGYSMGGNRRNRGRPVAVRPSSGPSFTAMRRARLPPCAPALPTNKDPLAFVPPEGWVCHQPPTPSPRGPGRSCTT
jgi:hypothetical protein